jgi:GNAT superfamily N-acetyltransferase
MTDPFALALDVAPTRSDLCDLREAVGWARNESDYPAAFERCFATVTARTPAGVLVGFCALVSDGVRHAFLIDVIVAPAWQRRGVGRALVESAVARARGAGIALVHVDFTAADEAFYRACGFAIGLAGILETRSGEAVGS